MVGSLQNWLLTSRYFPPRPGGTSTTYTNLLQHLDLRKVHVLTGPMGPSIGSESGLSCHVEVVPSPIPKWVKGKDYLAPLDVLRIARAGIRLAREHRVTRILATNPDLNFLVASYFIHRATGIPWYPYLHDTILEAQRDFPGKSLGRLFQDRIFRSSTKVFVLTPGLQELYRRKYHLETVLIPHCLDESLLETEERGGSWDAGEDKPVVFSGAIYWLNADSLRCLTEAVRRLPGLCLQIASFTRHQMIEQYGIIGPKVTASFLEDPGDVTALQREACLLYLPLTFDRAHAEEVDSAFPTKIIEYLVARVPILVHAPASSLLSRLCREEECALVVDQPDPEALVAAIRRLQEDQPLRQRLVVNAWRVAQRFRGAPIARRLIEEMFGEESEVFHQRQNG